METQNIRYEYRRYNDYFVDYGRIMKKCVSVEQKEGETLENTRRELGGS